jgi:hypothetical protein
MVLPNTGAMERWNSTPLILRHIIVGLALFVTGATLAFGYSYRPLHGALTWKIQELEVRLDERNREIFGTRDELKTLRADDSERVEPETLAQVERELEKTRSALRSAEKKTESAEKKRRDANANADRWRKRYEALNDAEEESMPAALSGPTPGERAQPTPLPGPSDLQTPGSTSLPPRAGSDDGFTPSPGSGMFPSRDVPARR